MAKEFRGSFKVRQVSDKPRRGRGKSNSSAVVVIILLALIALFLFSRSRRGTPYHSQRADVTR